MQNSSLSNKKDYSNWLFFGIVVSYIRLYAPYGINESDGGFITAYAWRLLNGEQLYTDIIYVRPPLTIWLRYLELLLLPDSIEVLAERWLFYIKVAAYSYLGAAILLKGSAKWWVAIFAFIISAHNYPAAAWHTLDGIFFSVLALWLLFSRQAVMSGAIAVVLAMLCKQSFYPLLPVYLAMSWIVYGKAAFFRAAASSIAAVALFMGYLYASGIAGSYFSWTSGASTAAGAFQHGVMDYLKIDTRLLLSSVLLIPLLTDRKILLPKYLWAYLFLAAVIISYIFQIYQQQDFLPPVHQSRLLFLLAAGFTTFQVSRFIWWRITFEEWGAEGLRWVKTAALLAVSWMAAVSWGYSLPVLFALPWVFVWYQLIKDNALSAHGFFWRIALLLTLLAVFRFACEFIYRDGRRSEMHYAMGELFPKLQYIYSDKATFEKYEELKMLHKKYGNCFKTLPAFPLSNYLTDTRSPLPLDWVIAPETNRKYEKLDAVMRNASNCYFFIEKSYGRQLQDNAKFGWTKSQMQQLKKIEARKYFDVYHH